MGKIDGFPREWEIWHAKFVFDNGKGYKFRPVLVIGSSGRLFAAAMVTSVGNKLSLSHDYVLRDWAEAGLNNPSIVRLDRIAELNRGDIGSGGKFGRLSFFDQMKISSILEAML